LLEKRFFDSVLLVVEPFWHAWQPADPVSSADTHATEAASQDKVADKRRRCCASIPLTWQAIRNCFVTLEVHPAPPAHPTAITKPFESTEASTHITMPPVAVLGAGGKTGAECVAALETQGTPVRAIVRNPAKYADSLGSRKGVEVVAGDVGSTQVNGDRTAARLLLSKHRHDFSSVRVSHACHLQNTVELQSNCSQHCID
jgi:hypothetical protein